jgi:phage baseplate assembly protein W
MADGRTYGLSFPFQNSQRGDYLLLTEYQKDEIRADLLHLLLTRKGSRYYLPDFGTRLYEFIFEPFDGLTFSAIESDIRDAINKYMPNLLVNNITIEPATVDEESPAGATNSISTDDVPYIYRVPGKGTADYTAKIIINYSTDSATFAQSDFVIINI